MGRHCVFTYTRGGCGMGGTVYSLYKGWVWHGWYCVFTIQGVGVAWVVLCIHYTRGGCGMGSTVYSLYKGWVWHGWYCVFPVQGVGVAWVVLCIHYTRGGCGMGGTVHSLIQGVGVAWVVLCIHLYTSELRQLGMCVMSNRLSKLKLVY